ncbi:hypothetical protein DSM07_08065 [Oenococcus sp. UCMA 16435]|nr:hypothetical protein DSM07_08065 [Oenococcus sp. UCMA 16435]
MMKGLIFKDVYVFIGIFRQKKFFIPILLVLILNILMRSNDGQLINMVVALFIFFTAQKVFEDKDDNWSEFIHSTWISEYKIIASRYIFEYLLIIFVSSLSFLVTEINGDFNKIDFIEGNLGLAIILFFFLLIFVTLTIPLSYLMGMAGMQTFVMIIFSFGLVIGQVVKLRTFNLNVTNFVTNNRNEVIMMAIIFTLFMIIISYFISVYIENKGLKN